ncbi:MAG: small GTP-binding protein [Gemmatimonadetes bacterium]|nr:small GTP-binding protein [Gemmatimonadota bacterium]
MRAYRASSIRNIAVVGHGGSGKTTLVDALAFASGTTRRHGSIAEGTTLTDTAPEEVERGYSINLGCAHAEWAGTKINLLDTPGFLDFQGDAIAGLAAADGALCVISATAGIEVGTERMFREALTRGDPVLFVVSMMDKEHADFDAIYRRIRSTLTTKVIPIEVPVGSGADFHGVVNLFDGVAHVYTAGGRSGGYTETAVPEEVRPQFDRYHAELIETIASTDDELLERYLNGGEISRDEAIAAMREAVKRLELFPLFCVSATLGYGTRAVLSTIVELMPSAYEMEEVHAFTGAEGAATVQIHADDAAPFSALVIKTQSEPHVGEVSIFRILSGSVASGDEVFNATRDVGEKLNHLAAPQGRERVEVPRLHAGDIGCVARLRNTHTNDTLSTRAHPVRLPQVQYPEPLVEMAIFATNRADEEKLQAGLHRLHDEDPTLQTRYNVETHETILAGMGERHLEIALAKLRRKCGVAAELRRPRIAYRETIRVRAEGQGRHKKQSGGRGQFGDCWVRIAPADRGQVIQFADQFVGGAIPSKFIPAVEKGIHEAAERGVLAGFPLVDFTVELYDGSYHTVDSNEMSFRMAGIQAFRTIAPKCKPVLLEPLDEVEIVTPEESLGDVLGDLSARRGHILGTETAEGAPGTRVRAVVPQSELHLYASALQSMTHGRALFRRHFSGYEEMPNDAAQKVVEEAGMR